MFNLFELKLFKEREPRWRSVCNFIFLWRTVASCVCGVLVGAADWKDLLLKKNLNRKKKKKITKLWKKSGKISVVTCTLDFCPQTYEKVYICLHKNTNSDTLPSRRRRWKWTQHILVNNSCFLAFVPRRSVYHRVWLIYSPAKER